MRLIRFIVPLALIMLCLSVGPAQSAEGGDDPGGGGLLGQVVKSLLGGTSRAPALTPDESPTSSESTTPSTVSANSGGPSAAVSGSAHAENDQYTVYADSDSNTLTPVVTANDLILAGQFDAELVSAPSHGTVDPGVTTYTVNPGFSGTDTFTYRITHLTPEGQFSESNEATVTMNVKQDVVDDTYTVLQDSGPNVLAPPIRANDDTGPNQAIIVSDPEHGTVDQDGTTYTPDPGFSGVDTFTYYHAFISEKLRTATVTINVTPVIAPPVAVNDAYTVAQDSGTTTLSPPVLGNDTTPAGFDCAAIVETNPAHGTVNTGALTYTPDQGFSGTDTFLYFVRCVSGQAGTTESVNEAIVTITVTPATVPPTEPEAPVANDDFYAMEENSVAVTLEPPVTDNDTTASGVVTAVTVQTLPAHGELNQTGVTSFQYTPDPGFVGEDTFTYQMKDAEQVSSNTATVTLLVTSLGPGRGGPNDEDEHGNGDGDGHGDGEGDEDSDEDDGGKLPDTGGPAALTLLWAVSSILGGVYLLRRPRRVE